MGPKNAAPKPPKVDTAASKDTASPPSPAIAPSSAHILLNARDAALETGYYLGDNMDTLRQNLAWHKVGRHNYLITRESKGAITNAINLQASDTDIVVPNPEMATISMIVQIPTQDFWMTSCGSWQKPTVAAKTIADVKLTCAGINPEISPLSVDFDTAMQNIKQLTDDAAVLHTLNRNGFIAHQKTVKSRLEPKVKFRHVLLEEVDCEIHEDDGSDWNIRNWPTIYPAAREALDGLVKTHFIRPLHAYDLQGNLIPPNQYRKDLEGSVARISFTLTHYSIGAREQLGKEASEAFVADVLNIRVLRTGSGTSVIDPSKKRKLAAKDPISTASHKN